LQRTRPVALVTAAHGQVLGHFGADDTVDRAQTQPIASLDQFQMPLCNRENAFLREAVERNNGIEAIENFRPQKFPHRGREMLANFRCLPMLAKPRRPALKILRAEASLLLRSVSASAEISGKPSASANSTFSASERVSVKS